MLASRSLRELCCLIQAALFNHCLSDHDLRELGAWADARGPHGLSPGVWCRALAHRACQRDEGFAAGIADLLDLRHLDAIAAVRASEPADLAERIDAWASAPDGAHLSGLLWALCTDARDEVHALGTRLCHEATTAACRSLATDSARRAG